MYQKNTQDVWSRLGFGRPGACLVSEKEGQRAFHGGVKRPFQGSPPVPVGAGQLGPELNARLGQ